LNQVKKALIFGATGFVGSRLLNELLSSSDYGQVTAVARRKLGIVHPRLKALVGDCDSLPALKADLVGDEIFIALGTTRKATPNKADYYRVDHDYPLLAARIAKEQGFKAVFLVSAVGANPHSKFFYVRTKGETERDIVALGFEHTHLFRPSMIMGNREEYRPFEKMFIAAFRAINPLLAGGLDKYRGVTGDDIARAMLRSAAIETGKVKIYHWRDMRLL
jgi:uncharacterized protein YbjT (DUF2867 family)